MAMLTQSCKKTYSRQPFTRQNSVVQETSIYSKMFPWINHTCILEHVFLSALIFKKRSHVLWQCWLKTKKLHIHGNPPGSPYNKSFPFEQPYTTCIFQSLFFSELILKNGPTSARVYSHHWAILTSAPRNTELKDLTSEVQISRLLHGTPRSNIIKC